MPNQSQFSIAHYGCQNYTTDKTYNSSSGNWTGYAVANSDGLGVAGAFTGESYSGPSDNTFGSWVGLGGNPYSNGRGTELLQAGYGKDESKGDLWAFVETNPNVAAQYLFEVNPGDVVGTVISRVSPGEWDVTVEDETTEDYWAHEYSISVDCSSADWITETSPGYVGYWNPVNFTGDSWMTPPITMLTLTVRKTTRLIHSMLATHCFKGPRRYLQLVGETTLPRMIIHR